MKDRKLTELGLTVVRFPGEQIVNTPGLVYRAIKTIVLGE